MDMANGWIIVRPMSEQEKLRDAAEGLLRRKGEEGSLEVVSELAVAEKLISSLTEDGDDGNGHPGDSILYIEFTDRGKNKMPKRPNDGTKRKTVDSGWFEEGEEYNTFASQPWYQYRERIGKVVVLDPWMPASAKYLFDGLTNCQEFNLLRLDTSRCTSFEGMFRGCSSVTQLFDLGRFSTSNVTSTSHMFLNCLELRTVSIASWDVSNIGDTDHMLSGCATYVLAGDKQKGFLEGITTNAVEKGVWGRTTQ